MSDVYNLQVKLDRKTEKVLRKLAEEDQRKLSNYCRVILTNWALENESNLDIIEDQETVAPPKKVETSKKKLVKKPTKEVKTSSDNRTETITLSDDMPKISGSFGLA